MPNYKIADILENPENTGKLYGYCGKIARINLSTKEVTFVNTYKYVPDYVGGRMLIHRLFWDEVPAGTGALDEGNKFMFMTGPTTGTGIPSAGRCAACAISPFSNPEQFSWGNIGGWFGTELKYAGYDGFIIEGKSDTPCYIRIEDDRIEILPADELWGLYVHETQLKIEEVCGRDYKSMVIGPAGENLVRFATIATANDSVLAKGGFGAVWGNKKLKAITVHGSGVVAPADIEKLKYLRLNMNHPGMMPSPVLHLDEIGVPGSEFKVTYDRGNVACSPGCNQHCNAVLMNGKTAFSETERKNHVEKCVSICIFKYEKDIPATIGQFWPSEKNYCAPCKLLSREFPIPDFSDPFFEEQARFVFGDVVNFWKEDYDHGTIINDMCAQYGIDKWEIIVFLMTWLAMCKKEGLFEGMDLGTGMEIDVENTDFMKTLITNLVYRRGEYGELLAEGMSRAIRALGYEKFSETVYHGRFSQQLDGKRLDLPVSLEAAWGQSVHWQGRGFEGTIDKAHWLCSNLINMLSTRDSQTVEHFHQKIEFREECLKDPYHSEKLIEGVVHTQDCAYIKDSISSCEWQSPHPWWPTMEAEMYKAATGYDIGEEGLTYAAQQSRLLWRAILIRNHGRTRRQEMEAIWRIISVPDPWNEVADWKQWNEFVDMYYEARGWDLETGWPYRETYEKYGLRDVADEMEALGLLPVHPAERWNDYGEAPFVLFAENRKKEPDYEA